MLDLNNIQSPLFPYKSFQTFAHILISLSLIIVNFFIIDDIPDPSFKIE